MSAFPVDRSLEQYYMQQSQQQAAARQSQLHDANMMQMAQAQQVARGQSSTSQTAAGGSPITQSVAKAKALALSSLDQDSLTSEQKQNLQELHDDPNTNFNAFNQAVGAVRQGQLSNQRQENLESRSSAANARRTASTGLKQTQAQIQDVVGQQRQAETTMKQAAANLKAMYGEEAEGPGNVQNAADPNYNALRKAYANGKQTVAAMQKQHDDLVSHMADSTESDDHGTANQADTTDGGPASITMQPPRPAQQGNVDTYSQPAIKPGSKGKATPAVIQQYHQRIGNNPDQIRAAMKSEGWSL